MPLRITTALLVGLIASTSHAASGFFNMPTTLPQCLGCGWGPGYHAEMVLKPYHRTWNAGQGVVRARPHQYPPIYHTRVAYGSVRPREIAPPPSYHHAPHAHYAPPQQTPTPAEALPAGPRLFSAPSQGPEEVPAEPASPSDGSASRRWPVR